MGHATKTTKVTQKRVDAAVTAFNARYADARQWGEQRWYSTLYPALIRPTLYAAVINRYAVDENKGRHILDDSEGSNLIKVELPTLSCNPQEPDRIANVNSEITCYTRQLHSDSKGDKPPALATSMLFPAPKQASLSSGHLLTHWNMDAASVLVAHMLDVQIGHNVLDMCAAPGGKSIALAQKLFPYLHQIPLADLQVKNGSMTSSLTLNEFDHSRYKRLDANLRAYLPPCLFPTPENPQASVKILNRDMSAKNSVSMLPCGPGYYDRVLIDAPCSSERHIIHAHEKAKISGQIAEEMLNWKSSHVATLVKIQTGLLHTALKAVKTGGKIIYATCALGQEENDGVIEKVLENLKSERRKAKRDGAAREDWNIEFSLGTEGLQLETEDPILQHMTESTKYGRIALPDHGGWGPLYFSVMTKVEKAKTKAKTLRSKEMLGLSITE